MDIRQDAKNRAESCWRKHKAPMALYWKVLAVYSGHLARMLRERPQQSEPDGARLAQQALLMPKGGWRSERLSRANAQ